MPGPPLLSGSVSTAQCLLLILLPVCNPLQECGSADGSAENNQPNGQRAKKNTETPGFDAGILLTKLNGVSQRRQAQLFGLHRQTVILAGRADGMGLAVTLLDT